MDMSTSLNNAEGVLKRGFLLPVLLVATSQLAPVNACYDKEKTKFCPGPLRIGLTTFTHVHKIVSSCLSVRLSVRLEQLGAHWKDFHEIWY